jgi:hypothetical protein
VKVATVARAGRCVLATAVVGLGAHAALYRSFWPHDSVHGYLGWYTLVVSVLSLGAIAGLAVSVAFALRARRLGRPVRVPVAAGPERTHGLYVAELAVWGLVWVYLQETLEHSVPSRELVFANFAPGQVLGLLLGVAGGALVLGFLMRAGTRVMRALFTSGAARGGEPTVGWMPHPAERRAWRPLASCLALRAPPLLSTA